MPPRAPAYHPVQKGYYCGRVGYTNPATCLAVPKNCGTANGPACPSNAVNPARCAALCKNRLHTLPCARPRPAVLPAGRCRSVADAITAKPTCKDGSYAFYLAPPNEASTFKPAGAVDPYMGVTGWCQKVSGTAGMLLLLPAVVRGGDAGMSVVGRGAATCWVHACHVLRGAPRVPPWLQVPANCGTGVGTPCCPMLYLTATNPPLPAKVAAAQGCGGTGAHALEREREREREQG